MKIVTFKVPGIIRRVGAEVVLELDEDNKQQVGKSESLDIPANEIPMIAKKLADENDTQRSLAKGTMMVKEQEAKVTLTLKYLTD
jgi:hypothetical protein